jgi:hypothetical protein
MRKGITSATPTIDKAEFHQLEEKVYCCKLYEGKRHKGTIPYIGGKYLQETKVALRRFWGKKIYPNIAVFKME